MLVSLRIPGRRTLSTLAVAALLGIVVFGLVIPSSRDTVRDFWQTKSGKPASKPDDKAEKPKPTPKYKPTPTYLPPPIKDNFPLLATSTPPPIPEWNVPRKDVHKEYDLPVAPPLFIGFTRSWPILLQAVVSYITAGWPADQIYVIENTGVQQANARGQLTLQNPFYLNHTVLKELLGVNIVQTPTLLSFAQMQNFFLSLTYANDWPYFFWSHMDVLVLSYEDGREKLTPPYNKPGYKSVYELGLTALQEARRSDPRWATRFFAYDHLALVNAAAYEDVGGWDTFIPYYITDCDMHSRLTMRNWTMRDAKAAIITDVAASLSDLRVLYRVDGVKPEFTDPNPPPPKPKEEPKKSWWPRRDADVQEDGVQPSAAQRAGISPRDEPGDPNLDKWHALRMTADRMYQHKHGDRDRNTWQLGQHGGQGEPFYYDAAGMAQALNLITENGREIFRRKWGHRDCDLITGAGLKFEDAWKVEKDWQD
ncbi:Glycosyl transferase family 8 protein [Madurella fahalii]|uniref:Glycosyl transferase family 8 protein n=1 Tax=Madurella fahalii TaxID=1157608 RepID=A0ABQ0GKE8_9PEZI